MKTKRLISPARASRILGLHINTLYNWCRSVLDGDGELSPLKKITRNNLTGYYWIDADEVRDLCERA